MDRYGEIFNRPYKKYLEPFVGGGSVLFQVAPQSALVTDINAELIATYIAVRDDPDKVEKRLLLLLSKHSERNFYIQRAAAPINLYDIAARMIYLNRTCFNGIYRVNKQGNFNVPIGDRRGIRYSRGDIAKAAKVLESVNLVNADFGLVLDAVEDGDLIYLDPPYAVNKRTDGFVRYNDKLFSWTDQLRLAQFAEVSVQKGASVVITNVFDQSLVARYRESGLFDVLLTSRYSAISAAAAARASVTEMLVISRDIQPPHGLGILK